MLPVIVGSKNGINLESESVCAVWERLNAILGPDIAFFIVCAYVDVPYKHKIAAKDWISYVNKLKENWKKDFKDGETDIRGAVKNGMSEMERWQAEWGYGDANHPYNAADYRRLDEILKTLSARNIGGMDAQQEFTLRYCAQMALLRDKNVVKDDADSIKKAKALDAMIQDNLAAESLRKKDVGQEQTARLDGIVDAMKRKYGFGPELTRAQAEEACAKWLRSRHYNCTRDAAEHAMLSIMNAMRINSDLPILPELPQEAQLREFDAEFEKALSAASDREKAVYDYLGLKRGILGLK